MNLYFPLQHGPEHLHPDDTPLMDIAPEMLEFSSLRSRSNEITLTRRQTRLAVFVLTFVFVAFLGRALFLQAFQGDTYRALAEENRTRTVVDPATRGIMYDAEGKQLVSNAPAFTLLVTPSRLPTDRGERLALIERAAQTAGISPTDIDLAIASDPNSADQPIPIDLPISYEAALRLYVEEERLPGFSVELLTVRSYETTPLQSLAHVLGYTGFISPEEYREKRREEYRRTDKIGKQGLEASYEERLRGQDGTRTVEVDALGREARLIREEASVPGENLHLALDVELTGYIEERVKAYEEKYGAHNAAVVVLDPRNGLLRALISTPGFDNNAFAKGLDTKTYAELIENPRYPLFARATSGEFPPGSTFKPTVAAIALEDGLINENTSFLSSGGISVGPWFFPDWKAGGHGVTNVRKAIAESVNTFFYAIGGGLGDARGLGIERITEGSRLLGFGSKTGIDLPEEADGFLPSKAWKEETKGERWYIGDTYHAAIGQGDILVTPLQMAVATSVFANRGTLYEPRLVEAIGGANTPRLDDAGEEARATLDPVVRATNVLKLETIEVVRQGMRQTVTAGSAQSLQFLSKPVAGKTGTAQAGGDRNNHAWFTSFGPYEDPELVVTVLVEEGGEGSSVSVPIARDIYAWWFANR